MILILVSILGFVIFCAATALVLLAVFAFERDDRVSDEWLRSEERRAHVRSVAHVDHQLYVDGALVLEGADEATCRAVGRAIVEAQRDGRAS